MAANGSNWISVTVRMGSSLLLPSPVIAISAEDTFRSVLSKVLASEDSDAQVNKVTISSDGVHDIVPLAGPGVSLLFNDYFCRFVNSFRAPLFCTFVMETSLN